VKECGKGGLWLIIVGNLPWYGVASRSSDGGTVLMGQLDAHLTQLGKCTAKAKKYVYHD
jgi:hypothetical protein